MRTGASHAQAIHAIGVAGGDPGFESGHMAKLAAMAVWVCIVALGSLFGSHWLSRQGDGAGSDAPPRVPFESAILSLPVYKGGTVEGYAILKFNGLADEEFKSSEQPPFDVLQKHAAYRAVHQLAGTIGFVEPGREDLDRLKAALRDNLNELAQADRVGGIGIEQLDFLQRKRVKAAQ